MKRILLLFSVFAFATPAFAELSCPSIEDRAEALESKLQGNNSYHAHLAREFANVALNEKGQHDLGVAKQFMGMAEDEAAEVGGGH